MLSIVEHDQFVGLGQLSFKQRWWKRRRDASIPHISSPSDTLTGSVFCMTVMGSLGVRPFREYRLIWYSTSGERSLTTTEVWPTPTYTSCRLLSAIIGIICTLYPVTCPIEGSQVTRMDFEATSRTWRFVAGSTAAESRILVWKWNCVSEIWYHVSYLLLRWQASWVDLQRLHTPVKWSPAAPSWWRQRWRRCRCDFCKVWMQSASFLLHQPVRPLKLTNYWWQPSSPSFALSTKNHVVQNDVRHWLKLKTVKYSYNIMYCKL